MMNGSENSCIEPTVERTITNSNIGLSCGTVTYRNFCQALAPSISAAS